MKLLVAHSYIVDILKLNILYIWRNTNRIHDKIKCIKREYTVKYEKGWIVSIFLKMIV